MRFVRDHDVVLRVIVVWPSAMLAACLTDWRWPTVEGAAWALVIAVVVVLAFEGASEIWGED